MKTIQTFRPAQVTVRDPYLVNAANREIAYLLSLDSDRLLASFRRNADLETDDSPYGGWESGLMGGHTMGHYLSALARAAAGTFASKEEKEELLEKLTYLVTVLAECQKHSKGKKGFLWGGKRLEKNVEFQFDNVEREKTNIKTEAWVPWYTMHKLIAGLLDVYRYVHLQLALKIACGLGDWTYRRVRGASRAKQHRILSVEYGGMNDCLYNLYEITKKEDYAVAAHFFDEQVLIDRILDGGSDYLDKLHANMTIPKLIGLANRFRLVHGKKIRRKKIEAGECLDAAKAFWEMVVHHHSYITGGNSEWEHFGLDDVLDAERTACNCETCNAYNMLKLSAMLFSVSGEKKYLDYYENAFVNDVLASQNPETGMTTYFQPMATGYFKVFSSKYDHFWCCTGTGMESFAGLGNNLYYHIGDCLIVALYYTSSVRWVDRGVLLTQEADLEHSDTVRFTLTGNCRISFRIPEWAKSYRVVVSGREMHLREECGFLLLHGRDGDVVELTFEKAFTAHSLPDDKDVYAFRYGPFVLASDLGDEDERTTTTGVDVLIPASRRSDADSFETEEGEIGAFLSRLGEHFVPEADGSFRLTGIRGSLVFRPYYRIYRNRYGIYHYFFAPGQGKPKLKNNRTIVDAVRPGYGQYETDVFHDLREENTAADTSGVTYRRAKTDGRFCYRMSVEKDRKNSLVLYLQKADNGKTLHITAANYIIYSGTLAYEGSEELYELVIPIPDAAVRRFEAVRENGEVRCMIQICFSGVDYAESAKVCDFVYTVCD